MKYYILSLCYLFVINLFILCEKLYLLIKEQNEENEEIKRKIPKEIPNLTVNKNLKNIPSSDSLEFLKSSQLSFLYYTILLYGAVYAVNQTLNIFKTYYGCRIILIAITFTVFDFSIYLTLELQYKILQQRLIRMVSIKKFRNAHYWLTNDQIKEQIEKNKKLFRDARITVLLIIINIFALVFVIYSFLDDLIFLE